MDYTIKESFILPSHGKIYKVPVEDHVSLRSMTTIEEMKRLSPSDYPYKMMAEIIDACIVDKPGISAYDMCLGDYQFLLHKLRIVTYGPEYSMACVCPFCGATNNVEVDLSSIEVMEWNDELIKYLSFTLPRTGKQIELNIQTPRMFDIVAERKKNILAKTEGNEDPTLFLTLEELIKSIDGQAVDPGKLAMFVRGLPMADANMILKCAEKMNTEVGLNTRVECACDNCHLKYNTSFRITGEFFGPSVRF